jgi:hypothetical protein
MFPRRSLGASRFARTFTLYQARCSMLGIILAGQITRADLTSFKYAALVRAKRRHECTVNTVKWQHGEVAEIYLANPEYR